VWSLDPTLPITRAGTLESHLSASLVQPRFYTGLLAAFGGLAGLLAIVGLYATLAFSVRIRTREMGVRMAFGATCGQIRALVVRSGLALSATGIGIGLVAALLSNRLLRSLIFGVEPDDAATLAAAAAVMAVAAIAASLIPAARAAGTRSLSSLRSDA
jgi:ABC-type antimicrobial peptide transport system permease subunit